MTVGRKNYLRLGVNIDHIATIRNARSDTHPDPIKSLEIIEKAGANGITAHLREDRRHIKDQDIFLIKENSKLPFNMEMAATEEMLNIALKVKPNACCIVPEKRNEITTEGGLNVISAKANLKPFIKKLQNSGIKVSLFVDPDLAQIEAAQSIGADIIELHTGQYCHSKNQIEQQKELQAIQETAKFAKELNLECHAGHGLCYKTTPPIAKIDNIVELNIGHFLISESIFVGLYESIRRMREVMDKAR